MFLVSGIFGTATDVNDVNIIIYRNLFEAAEKEFKAAEKKLESEISDKDLRLLIIDNIENNTDIKDLIEEYLKAEDLKNLLPSIRINLPLKKEKIIDFINTFTEDTLISQEIIDTLKNLKNAIEKMNTILLYLVEQELYQFVKKLKEHITNNPPSNESLIEFITNLETSIAELITVQENFNKATEYRGINSTLESLSKKINIKFAEIVNVNTNNNLKDHITDRHSSPFYGSHTMKKDICKYVIDYFKAKKNFDNNKRKLNSLRALSKGHSISLN